MAMEKHFSVLLLLFLTTQKMKSYDMKKYEPEYMSSEFAHRLRTKLEIKPKPFPASSVCFLKEELIKSELSHTD